MNPKKLPNQSLSTRYHLIQTINFLFKDHFCHRIHTSSKAKSTLIVNSDSDDDFVVKEQKVQEDERKQKYNDLSLGKDLKGAQEGDQEHGALVKKILESKEQLEYGSELNRNQDFVCFLFCLSAFI